MTKKERFVLWLNKLGRGCNRITIVVLYITIMIILGALIYGANQQKATSNVTVSYSRPSYTVSFDPAGGEVSPSYKTVKLGDNYGDLPTPTRAGYTFNGWQTSDGTAVTSTTQNTTIGDHILTAKWVIPASYLTRDWTSRIGDNTSLNSVTTSIIFTKDSSQISGLSNSVSVGTNSPTSTSAYTATPGVEDVRAYWGSDKTTIVIYSPCTIYAPQDCSYLFLIDYNQGMAFEKLTNLDLTNFDTSNVTNMSSMFFYCIPLTSLDVSNFNTSSVTDMSYMFYACTALTSLDVSNFDTSNVTDMSRMFQECSSLTSLDVSNFNTSNVTNMYNMFYNCSLTSLDVSHFDTSKVINMSGVFGSCSFLTSLDVSHFDTSKVTNMKGMFWNCSSLTSLNLGNFNLASCTNFDEMLYGCSALTSITLPYNLQSGKIIYLPASTYYNGSAGPYSAIGTATSGTTVACSTASSKVTLEVPSFLTRNWTSRIGDNTSLKSVTTSIIFTKDSSQISGLSNSVSVGTNSPTSTDAYSSTTGVEDVTAYWGSDKSTIVIYSPCTIYAPQDCSKLFTVGLTNSNGYNLSKLTNLDLTNFNTNNVTNMSYMFYNCKSLTSLDVSHFNTSNVTNMSHMFRSCSSLTSLDVSNFDTSEVTDMSYMFMSCLKVTSLDVRNFDTSKVTNMESMFYNCSSLTSLDVSNFNTSKVTRMSFMFYTCSTLTSLDVSNFDTSKVTNMNSMFDNCSSLTSLDVSNFDTSKVTWMSNMFESCSSLTSLNLGNFNLASCTHFDHMLYGCSALTSITLPYNLQSGYTIALPASTYYSGSAGPYRTIGTATSGTTVACSTASNKVTLTKH